jgi:hypothetical protein
MFVPVPMYDSSSANLVQMIFFLVGGQKKRATIVSIYHKNLTIWGFFFSSKFGKILPKKNLHIIIIFVNLINDFIFGH